MRTWKGPPHRGQGCGGPRGGVRSPLHAAGTQRGDGFRVGSWHADIEHRIPQELPECFPAFLVSPHRRNGLKLEMQDDIDQDFSSRKLLTISDVRRVGPGDTHRVPELFVRHTTTGHRAIMVRQ